MITESGYQEFENLDKLFFKLREAGCQKVLIKSLAKNDNKKQQIYFGSNFQALNELPSLDIYSDPTGSHGPTFKAALDFYWLNNDGNAYKAPGAQLILYPQYPEVRFSGFLQRAEIRPSELMTQREVGRVLIMGILKQGSILGHIVASDSPVKHQISELSETHESGVFQVLTLDPHGEGLDTKSALTDELIRVHTCGWINSKRLDSDGSVRECKATNCGGLNLEAELGITPSGRELTDYLGWEIKSYSVSKFDRYKSSHQITLMTPEPTGGYYQDEGIISFVRRYGYPDTYGREDRMNFSSTHRFNEMNELTGLKLKLVGYQRDTKKIIDADGYIALISKEDDLAAAWSFTSMLKHWNKKHNQAAYIPYVKRDEPLQYSYGDIVGFGEGTDFLRFLEAMASGLICYDPGTHVARIHSEKPKPKRRSQFRIKIKDVNSLYYSFGFNSLISEGSEQVL